MPLAEVKNRSSEVADRLEREHGRVVITKHRRPVAAVLTVENLENLENLEEPRRTSNVMADPKLMLRVRQSQSEREAGDVETLTKDGALALITRKR